MTTKSEKLDQLIALQRGVLVDRARRGNLLAFTKLTKPDYDVGLPHKITSWYLQKFLRKEIKRLIILEPPRHGKSELSSRRMPALIHGLFPNDEILAAAYNSDLASDMTVDVQRIMDNETYQSIFPFSKITPEGTKSNYARSSTEHELIPMEDVDGWKPEGFVYDKSNGFLLPRGSYRSSGVGGSATGRGANWFFIDDPVKNREEADSEAYREALWNWFRSTCRTRLEKDGSICITMTQWHEDDLVGRILKLQRTDPDADQYVVLRFPAIKETEEEEKSWCDKNKLPPNEHDKRKPGEALWPEKYDVKDLKATKATIGTRDWSALYQQNPTAEGGNLVKREWFKWFEPKAFDLKTCNKIIISCDMATKDKKVSDYYCYQVWALKQADRYLIYQMRGRWDFPTALQKFVDLVQLFPQSGRKFIEAKANGPAVAQSLRKKITGIIEREPDGDKIARLNAVTPEMESGNVWLPNPDNNPWVNDYLAELCAFPLGTNDDQVDATSQALVELRTGGPVYAPIAGHSGAGVIHG